MLTIASYRLISVMKNLVEGVSGVFKRNFGNQTLESARIFFTVKMFFFCFSSHFLVQIF